MIAAPQIALAALVAIPIAAGLGAWRGYSWGVSVEQARQDAAREQTQRQLFQAGEQMSRLAAQLIQSENRREAQSVEIENEALDALHSDRPALDLDGVRRLNRRWSSP